MTRSLNGSKAIENVVDNKSGCMNKPVNLVRYDMSSFMDSCVDAYCELAKVQKGDLPTVATPFTEAGIARPTLDEKEKPGEVAADRIKGLDEDSLCGPYGTPRSLKSNSKLGI